MAYGSWSSGKWKQIWANSYYRVDVEWSARTDPIANTIQYRVTRIRCTSLSSARSFWNTGTVGIATITAQRKTYSKSLNVPKGGSQIVDLTDDSRELSCKSDGSVNSSEVNVHGYYKAGVNANGTPEIGWTVAEITSELPKIDRSGGTTTASVASKTYNSVTIKVTSTVATTLIQYSLNNGTTWVDAGVDLPNTGGGTTSFTIGGLSPNTSYTIKVRQRRDYNQVYSSGATVSVTTSLPGKPTVNSLSLVSKTYNSVTVKVSGAYGAGHPSGVYGYYRVKLSSQSAWTKVTNQNAQVISGLSPNTAYTIQCQLVDYYGQVSDTKTLAVTTALPALPSGGTVSVSEITHKSAKMTYSGFKAGAGASIARYDVAMRQEPGSVPWVDNGLNTTYTGTGLPPNTYCIARVTAVDNFGQRSAYVDAYFTTNKPPAPTKGTFEVVELTSNSIKISISGFIAGDMAEIVDYKLSVYSVSPFEVITEQESIGNVSEYNITGLQPNTKYLINIQAVDNYGTGSPASSDFVTTLEDQAKVRIKVSGVWETGKIWIKQQGLWKKIKHVYVKNGTWKKSA